MASASAIAPVTVCGAFATSHRHSGAKAGPRPLFRAPPPFEASRFQGSFRQEGSLRRGLGAKGWQLRYKEKQIETDVHDWRIKQMCEVAHKYYVDMWSKGDEAVAEEILDEEVELKDELWGSHPFVGKAAMKKQVKAFRKLYPDLVMEIDNIGVYGTQDLAIRWSARATNLGGQHPTHHYTHFSGISSLHFSDDRKRVAEVVTYRQPTSEEMTNKCEVSWRREPSTTEIQLVPLHVSTANYDYLPELKKGKAA